MDIHRWDYSIIQKKVFYCNTGRNKWWWVRTTLYLCGKIILKTCNTKEANEERQILFSRDNKVTENIPPTKAALRQHVLRSVLKSSKWRRSYCKEFDDRNACQWGWQKLENEMMPLWSNFPELRTYAENLLNVTKGCLRWCKCLTPD